MLSTRGERSDIHADYENTTAAESKMSNGQWINMLWRMFSLMLVKLEINWRLYIVCVDFELAMFINGKLIGFIDRSHSTHRIVLYFTSLSIPSLLRVDIEH